MTPQELAQALQAATFVFAKTMPDMPHEYTLRKTWRDQQLFVRAVLAIREHGYDKEFKKRSYRYFSDGTHEYWTMGAPVHTTILINRRALNRGDDNGHTPSV